jgi:hypothetical protein
VSGKTRKPIFGGLYENHDESGAGFRGQFQEFVDPGLAPPEAQTILLLPCLKYHYFLCYF